MGLSLRQDIHEEIFKAIDYLVDHKIKTSGFDKTSVGTVIEVLENNSYHVVLNNNTHTFSCAVDLDLSIGNSVYVTAPQGNLSNAYISGIRRNK